MARSEPITLETFDTLKYEEYLWGDLISGSKEQIIALGVGVDLAFPGELGGPKRKLTTIDPRGYKATIERCRFTGTFEVRIKFPDREQQNNTEAYAPGVKKECSYYFDRYTGSAESLQKAGLTKLEHLPGEHGMRKVCVTLLPDGRVLDGHRNARNENSRSPGAKHIHKISRNRYAVDVFINDIEKRNRAALFDQEKQKWEERVKKMPKPASLLSMAIAKLRSLHADEYAKNRAAICLVWSKPAPSANWTLQANS